MTHFSAIMSAFSQELADLSAGLTRLQEVPLLPSETGAALSGDALLRAMVALQDLDRMTQTAEAMSAVAARLARDGHDGNIATVLDDLPLRSLAERLGTTIQMAPAA